MSEAAVRRAPGPRGHFLWGSLPQVRRDPLALYREAVQRVWSVTVVRFRSLPSANGILVTHPSRNRIQWLQRNARNFRKGRFFESLSHLAGQRPRPNSEENFLEFNNDAGFNRSFTSAHLDHIAAIMTEVTAQESKRWGNLRDPTATDGFSTVPHAELTLQVICRTLFGAQLSPEELHVFRETVEAKRRAGWRGTTISTTLWRFPFGSPSRSPPTVSYGKVRQKLYGIVDALIESRRHAACCSTHDFLSLSG